MQHEVFGKLTYDEEEASWSGRCKVAAFAPFRQTPHGKGKAPTTFDLFVDADDGAEPVPSQVRAFESFVEHEASICAVVLDAIFRWYERWRKQDPEWFEMCDCPEIGKSDELRDLMEFDSLRIRGDEFKGTALIGLSFDCEWDDEHGLGVLMHRGTILDLGGADVAFTEPDPAGSAWLKMCSEREKEAARTVLEAFKVERREPEYTPFEKAYIEQQKLNDDDRKLNFELLRAIDQKDEERIRSLIEQGADINGADEYGIHPLFSAIRKSNVFAVKAMLELGADVRATFIGKTPLEMAIETIEVLGYRPGGPLGDRFKETHDRAAEVLRLLRDAEGR